MNTKLNKVGLGTFPFASVFNAVTDQQIENVIDSFIENGGYYIDTAPLYGFGKVESELGKYLKKFDRDKYFLANKCGYVDVKGKDFSTVKKGASYKEIIQECDKSLAKTNVDFFDLYMLHSPSQKEGPSEIMPALLDLKKQGKVKQIGLSNVNLQEIKQFFKFGQIDYIQNRFNLITRSVSEEMKAYLLQNNIGFIPYHVLEIGILTGKSFEGIENLDPKDFRNNFAYWQKKSLIVMVDWVKKHLAPIAKSKGCTIGQLAIAWTLKQSFVPWIIVGTTNPKYASINLKANDINLAQSDLEGIEKAYLSLVDQIKTNHNQTLKEFRGLNEKFY